MAYVNIFEYNPNPSIMVKKFIHSGNFTYVLGSAFFNAESVKNQMYLGKLDANGKFVWQRRYVYPDEVFGGYIWDKIHFSGLVVIPGSQDVVVLMQDYESVLIMKLSENGNIVWAKKIFDKKDVPLLYDFLSITTELHILSDQSVIVSLQEIHSQNGGVKTIRHNLYRINHENGAIELARQIPTSNTLLLVRQEKVEGNLLTFYGGYAETAAILQIDRDFNIVKSVGFSYSGGMPGFNSFQIYAASKAYNGKISVMGSFYHYDPSAATLNNDISSVNFDPKRTGLEWILNRDIKLRPLVLEWIIPNEIPLPLPAQYRYVFVAEINADYNQIFSVKQTRKDFSATVQTTSLDEDGIFFSIWDKMYHMNSAFTQTEWAKVINVPESNGSPLRIEDHTESKVMALYDESVKLTIAKTTSNLDSCRTILKDDLLKFEPLQAIWVPLQFTVSALEPINYGTPMIEVYNISAKITDALCPPTGAGIIIDANTRLQSPDLYLQAAGSTGADSTEGIHLRWMLKNSLQNHLPKGDYFQGLPTGHNKPDDYVEIYRAPYNPVRTQLLFTQPPNSVVDSQARWLYNIGNKYIYVYFRNVSRYQQIRGLINPLTNPSDFMAEYGENLVEVESANNLFFGIRLNPSVSTGTAKVEILSEGTEQQNPTKNVTYRNHMSASEMGESIFAENGRSIRFVPFGCFISAIYFEFYIDFINKANTDKTWAGLGKYGLSLDNTEVYRRLEPKPDERPVHARWLRYNDGEYVNIRNYQTKWDGDLQDPRERIKDSVEQYLHLSNDPMNPLANETYYLNDQPTPDGDNGLEISHLTILQMASMDYHVARMLGMGILDLDGQVYNGQQYMYIAQYFTLQNNNSNLTNNHLYLSLPTSLYDQRLSLPVDLKEPVPGIVSADTELNGGVTQTITDEEGYSHDGRTRYISLFTEPLIPDEPADSPFYYSTAEFYMATFTYPVYVGIEYKNTGASQWQKPELPYDSGYLNVTGSGSTSKPETIAIAIPEVGQPAFMHRESRSGMHTYGSYGVNWFSRGNSSYFTWDIETNLVPKNPLLPPSNINALLIQEESPLFLTSQNEQSMLSNIINTDKTFVRLIFEYDVVQDMISYQEAVDGQIAPDYNPLPDNEEIFANEIELFFSPEVPEQIFGIVTSVTDFPGNPLIAVIESGAMQLSSAGQILYPSVDAAEIPYYIGGALLVGADEFIIHNIEIPVSNPLLPIFYVLKKQVSNAFNETNNNIPYDPADFIAPESGASFMFTRNMLNTVSWGTVNPHPFKVEIGNNWAIHHEEVTILSGEGNDTTENTYFRKFRGFVFNNATIKQYTDSFSPDFVGLYEITFPGFTIGNHPQFNPNVGQSSVQWYRGSIRVPYQNNENGERKSLKVLRFHEEGGNLIVYAQDENYSTDPLQIIGIRNNVWVNFYPGYRVYLYHNSPCRLTENHIIPQEDGILEKYSIFGMRSIVTGSTNFISQISKPTMMFARRFEKPETPEQPMGALYATRPDYYGRSTYTFTTKYTHKPFSVSVCRTNDDILLSSLYLQTPYGQNPLPGSVEEIRLENNDAFANDRLLDLANVTLDSGGQFPVHGGSRFPMPNSPAFFEGVNAFIVDHNNFYGDSIPPLIPGTVTNMHQIIIPEVPNRNAKVTFYDFVKQTVVNSYVPLTEVPMIYQYIKDGAYMPLPKQQTIRDRNGVLLKPTDSDFDIAPMMKIMGTNPHKTLFTDFTLDGASTSVYFYAVRETDAQMKQGELSEAIGPIRLVNSYAVKTPEIKSVIPILENNILGIVPAMKIQINSYEPIHNVTKINLYRALNMGDAASVRSMTLIKTIDLEVENMLENEIWNITDDFADLTEVPFGDALYYRVTVEAKVEYAEPNYSYDDGNPNNVFTIITDFAPSQASKLMITMITENVIPNAPILSYTATTINPATLGDVVLEWNKQAYKGKYYLYKMNEKGNWEQIAVITNNDNFVEMALNDTDWGTDQLIIQTDSGEPIYHHFKVVTENTAGMSSTEEIMLTIPSV